MEDFHRIQRLPPYIFAVVNELKSAARRRGEDIIDFGMGNPDQPTPAHIVDKLCEAVRKPAAHRYSLSKGIPGLRKAVCGYYKRRFDVDLDPETEAIVTIGSKEGLAHLSLAITEQGNTTILAPNPAYPLHPYGFIISGAYIHHIPLFDPESFLQEAERAIRQTWPRPKVLIVNFPSNPTAMVVELDFYERVVALAKEHDLIVFSDIAYAEICFDGYRAPSILQVPGARDVAVEFYSLSKTYNMPGWRVGFACGNSKLVHALARIKSYLDYGMFLPIQIAATAALNGPQECVDEIRELYRGRRDLIVDGLSRIGWAIERPKASMFVWARIPEPFRKMGSLEFSKLLIKEAKVAVSPGIGFGDQGDEFVRIALIENEHRTRQAIRNMRTFFNAGGDVSGK